LFENRGSLEKILSSYFDIGFDGPFH